MNARQYAAGWRDASDLAAAPPACIGSGQSTLFAGEPRRDGPFSAAWDTCPECGRRVQLVNRDDLAVLAAHTPPTVDEPARKREQLGDGFGL